MSHPVLILLLQLQLCTQTGPVIMDHILLVEHLARLTALTRRLVGIL
jgi:hypothetical protein